MEGEGKKNLSSVLWQGLSICTLDKKMQKQGIRKGFLVKRELRV